MQDEVLRRRDKVGLASARALALSEKNHGRRHPKTIAIMETYASLLKLLDRDKEATFWKEQAEESRKPDPLKL